MKNRLRFNFFYAMKTKWSLLFLFLLGLFSCNSFLDSDLNKSLIVEDNVFNNDVTATSAIVSMYTQMTSTGLLNAKINGVISLASLSAGELYNYKGTPEFVQFSEYFISPENDNLEGIWNDLYNLIYQANAVIEGCEVSTELTSEVAEQLIGEALFMRAFVYFYLVNLFGELPLISETDYRMNRYVSRTSEDEINGFIEDDLLVATSLLKEGYLMDERIRPNRYVAFALLSRVYLYMQEYEKSLQQADSVIANTMYELEDDLEQVFLSSSRETIWQLYPTNTSRNTFEGYFFIITRTPSYHVMNDDFYQSFEPNDNRKDLWIGTYSNSTGTWNYPYKYKVRTKKSSDPFTEYSIVFRLAELYLIRAECFAKIGDYNQACENINIIRSRAGLEDFNMDDATEILLAIENERRFELFTEYGHRWFDLKRTGRAVSVLGGGITEEDLLYPIPAEEFLRNPTLGMQNAGY